MYSGPIIDTHMHLWDLANGYAWLNGPDPNFERLIGNYDALRRNFIASDYAALTHGHKVLKSVHIQAFGFPENPVGETAWLQALAPLIRALPAALVIDVLPTDYMAGVDYPVLQLSQLVLRVLAFVVRRYPRVDRYPHRIPPGNGPFVLQVSEEQKADAGFVGVLFRPFVIFAKDRSSRRRRLPMGTPRLLWTTQIAL
jgi:hypothetical protein